MIKRLMIKLRKFLLDDYAREVNSHIDGVTAELKSQLAGQAKQLADMESQLAEERAAINELRRQMELDSEQMKHRLAMIEAVARNGWLAAARGEDTLEAFQSNWLLEMKSQREDISGYKLAAHIRRLHELLPLKKLAAGEGSLYRTGHDNDGGYIMRDRLLETKVAYSFGISDDVSWDKFMADKGFDVYMYDHTIEALPEENERFHWQKIGLAGIYDEGHPELRTLPMLLEDNGHTGKKHIILKMDIEGAEWSALANLPDEHLEQFDQIMMEMHDLNNEDKMPEFEKALTKLNKTHQLVHIHGNNWEDYTVINGMVMPDVIECTYIKKDLCDFEECDSCLPDGLDRANNEKWPDIFLGKWN